MEKNWEVHQGDCITLMDLLLDDGSVDMVLTDPPYGMKYQSGRRAEKFDAIHGDANTDVFAKALPHMVRVLKQNAHMYVFCSWHKLDEFVYLTKQHRELTLKNLIVWAKNNHGSGDLKGAYAPKHELVLFLQKGRRELAKRIPDVIEFPKVPANAMRHPTEKPVGLLNIFVNNSSLPGETILDPFTGGGSTGMSAVRNGRRFIGFEMHPEYFAVAESRVAIEAAKAAEAESLV